MPIVKCELCGVNFKKWLSDVKRSKTDFCSIEHRQTIQRERLRELNKNRLQEKHPQWKGDKVGYRALHHWIKRQRGIPTTCEHCGESPKPKIRRRVQWANKSGRYLRELSDWMALCVPCHKRYDIAKKHAYT